MAARAKRGDGSIRYDRKAKAYVGRLSLWIDGKRERPSVTGRTYTECRTALRKLLQSIETGERPARRDQESVAPYLDDWLAISSFAPSTLIRYKSLAKKILSLSWFAKLKLHEATAGHVLRLYAEMAAESASTRRKVHVLLHTAFADACHVRRIALNPCDLPKKQKPKYCRPDVRPFDEVQEAAFLDATKGDKHEALYLLALDSGARQGELWALEWQDVDLEAGVIRIRRTLKDGNGGIEVGPTKVRSERTLTISRSTLAALRSLRKANRSAQLVFPNAKGGYMRRQNFNRRDWLSILEKANLSGSGFTFHDLRHSCATMLLRNGESIASVSKRLGHSKVSTTLDYYVHALPRDDARSADAFERRLTQYGVRNRTAEDPASQ